MGGRGASGANGKGQSSPKPQYFAETEKAVQLRLIVNDFDLGERSAVVWVPKSMLAEDGRPGEWISVLKADELSDKMKFESPMGYRWEDKSGESFKYSLTKKDTERREDFKKRKAEREKRFEAGKQNYNALIAEAKALGIKGVRVGLKKKTLEKKIREAKNRK